MSDINKENNSLSELIDSLELELKIKHEELKARDETIKALKSKINELNHKILELETRIDIFQNQITPSVAESIKEYRYTIVKFEKIVKNKDRIIEELKNKIENVKKEKIELGYQLEEKQKLLESFYNKFNLLPKIFDIILNELESQEDNEIIYHDIFPNIKEKIIEIKDKDDSEELTSLINKLFEILDIIENKDKIIKFLKTQILEQKQLISKLLKEELKQPSIYE